MTQWSEPMSDQVTESFKCDIETSKKIELLSRIYGSDGKSEYLRHLVSSAFEEQAKKAPLFEEVMRLKRGNNNGDEVITGNTEK